MIVHLCYDVYQGVLEWFCGLASELELAPTGAVPPAIFPKAGPGARASDRAQQFALQTPTSQQAKSDFGALCKGRGRERVTFMILVLVALHLTL
jgi:hypothetical protein